MEMSKDFFIGDGWLPACNLLEFDVQDWFYKESIFQTEKKKQVYLDGHTFNLPIESHSIVFRWIMPKNPKIYDQNWEVPEDYRMASVMRFTVGEWLGLTEKDLKEVRDGRANIPKDRLSHISDMLSKSFLFNGLKIPYIDVRWDTIPEPELNNFVSFHSGKIAEEASLIAKTLQEGQEKQKTELLQNALVTLRSKPVYLSILRDVVGEKISIERAIDLTGNSGIFQKGV